MSEIIWLDPDNTDFPPASSALSDPNGLLGAGGDLSSQRLISAYRQGVFPWYEDNQPILWWSPDPRCVIFPEQLHISKSLKKVLRKKKYEVVFDQDFSAVIDACSAARKFSDGTWITQDMKNAYITLSRQGIAHSVEVRREGRLIGGLYGLAMGRFFFGESMFSHETNASKIAFVHLVEQLRSWGYYLIDCQVYSEHLTTLGACEISRNEYLDCLDQWVEEKLDHPWQFEWSFENN
jgi:leucyl/phenylalanyl-tRNA--protein transferase